MGHQVTERSLIGIDQPHLKRRLELSEMAGDRANDCTFPLIPPMPGAVTVNYAAPGMRDLPAVLPCCP